MIVSNILLHIVPTSAWNVERLGGLETVHYNMLNIINVFKFKG